MKQNETLGPTVARTEVVRRSDLVMALAARSLPTGHRLIIQ